MRFLGYRFGKALASHMAGGDVFVFPSRTDTFGIVLLEALALDRRDCRAFVADRSWRRSTLQFESYLAPRTRSTAAAQPDSSASR